MMMRRMSALLSFLVLLSGSVGVGADDWFRSNPRGVRLEAVDEQTAREGEWALRESVSGLYRETTLFRDGQEVERRRTAPAAGRIREATLWEDGRETERRRYDGSGRLTRRETRLPGDTGWTTETFLWEEGRLYERGVRGPDGSLLYTDVFLTRSDGSLRQLQRTYPDGSRSITSWRGDPRGGSVQEQIDSGEDRWRNWVQDDSGSLVRTRLVEEGRLMTESVFSYDEDGLLLNSREIQPESGETIRRQFDGNGLPLREEVRRDGRLIRFSAWERQNGRLVRILTEGEGRREVRRYNWEGDRLTDEALFVDDVLTERILYRSDGSRTVELWAGGRPLSLTEYGPDGTLLSESYTPGGAGNP